MVKENELVKIVGNKNVLDDQETIEKYSKDMTDKRGGILARQEQEKGG